jgi:RNA polymerase sigma-70 factor (ECF subfamily)
MTEYGERAPTIKHPDAGRGSEEDVTTIARSDSVLLHLTAAGDHRAWEELRHRHSLPLYAHVFALVGERSTAEQVVAETFEEAWFTAAQFALSEDVNATAWLVGLARRLVLARQAPASAASNTPTDRQPAEPS